MPPLLAVIAADIPQSKTVEKFILLLIRTCIYLTTTPPIPSYPARHASQESAKEAPVDCCFKHTGGMPRAAAKAKKTAPKKPTPEKRAWSVTSHCSRNFASCIASPALIVFKTVTERSSSMLDLSLEHDIYITIGFFGFCPHDAVKHADWNQHKSCTSRGDAERI